MADQPRLFDIERPEPEPIRWTAGTCGEGPEGETCRTCLHLHRHFTHPGGRIYPKCGLTRWTRGPATDIKTSWPACEYWTPPNPPAYLRHITAAGVPVADFKPFPDGLLIAADAIEESGRPKLAATLRRWAETQTKTAEALKAYRENRSGTAEI